MNIVLCEDDTAVLFSIANMIRKKYGTRHNVICYEDYDSVIAYINNNQSNPMDVFITDIELDDKNGIDAAHLIYLKHPETAVIFVTGFQEKYYEKVFLYVKPLGFICKPVKESLLYHFIDEAEELKKAEKKTLKLNCNGVEIFALQSKIKYIEKEKRLLKFFLTDVEYSEYGKFSDIEPCLDKSFLRCHNSFIVNLNFVVALKKDSFVLSDGKEIPISRSYLTEAKQQYFMYRGNM